MHRTSERKGYNVVQQIRVPQRDETNRRDILRWTGLLLMGGSSVRLAKGTQNSEPAFTGLSDRNHIDVETSRAEMIEEAYRWGHDYEARHGGCCRCTVAALQRAMKFVPQDNGLFRAASCLDGGCTPTGVQNCGAFTGAGMFIGWVCSVEGFGDTALSRRLMRDVYKHFNREYDGVLCKDVRKGVKGDCPEAVGRAARWTAEALLRQFATPERK